MCEELNYPFLELGANEKALVFDFVGYFSRMEYSMKRAGYYVQRNNGKVDADWQAFAQNMEEAFADCDLNAICPTLYNHPPKEQVVNEDGEMGWRTVLPQGSATSLQTISLSLRRARNNLFHGGKYHGDGVHGFDRSNVLLREGVALIKCLALLDEGVKQFWNYDQHVFFIITGTLSGMEYDKERVLAGRLNDFLTSSLGVEDADYYSNMDFLSFMKLKSVLSDINNIITMKVTLTFVDWLASRLGWGEEERQGALNGILSTKPNANGYDVELDMENCSVIAEVKCNIPINGGNTYGAAQHAGILKDVKSLVEGKSKSIMQPADCLKFMVFVALPEIRKATEKFIDARKEFGDTICVYQDGMALNDSEKVYVVFVDLQ